MTFLFLAACAMPDSGAGDAPGADSAGSPVAERHDADRVESEGFRAHADTFVAWQPLSSLAVTVAEERTSLRAGGDALELTTVAWGREGAPIATRLGLPEEQPGDEDPAAPDFGRAPRIVRDSGALAEWWRATPGRVQFGWDLAEPPEGEGFVVVDVAVYGADVEPGAGDEDAVLHTAAHSITLGGLRAWDDAGRPLPAWMELGEGSFRVVVDDADATWPVHIDPSTLTASWSTNGGAAWTYMGQSLAGIGDVNNDGYADFAIDTYTWSSNLGKVGIYHGSASGPPTSASSTLYGTAVAGYFGLAMAGVGDLNGDGYDDFASSSPGMSSTANAYAYIFHGSASGVSSTVMNTYSGTGVERFGALVDGAGDVNNDGYDDVLITAMQSATTYANGGAAWVYHGSSTGLATAASTTLASPGVNAYFGWGGAGVGDVNGDGYDDVAIGAPGYSSNTGRVYIYHGSSSGLRTAAATVTTVTGAAASGYYGMTLDGGDVNADGYSDLIVGAPYYSSSTGAAYVYHGSSSGINTTAATNLAGLTSGKFGTVVKVIGDFNQDGYGDVIVTAPDYSPSNGVLRMYPGSATGVSTTYSGSMSGAASSDKMGTSADSLGDVDGDGVVDLLVGAYGYSSGAGWVGVVYGLQDADGDGYMPGTGTTDDCDDTDAAIHPGATELTGDGVDQNCDGAETCYDDDDNDGYLDSTGDTRASTDTDCADAYEGTSTDLTTDCSDSSATRHPGATEVVANGTDEDCDGYDVCYDDDDNDGYLDTTGDTRVTSDADCTDAYEGLSSDPTTDCDDSLSTVKPGATEVTGDSIDENCDGTETCYDDDDNDGWLDSTGDVRSSADTDCADAYEGTSSDLTTDCNDASTSVHPTATELVADGIDEDCDGYDSCYDDDDNDGYLDTTGDTRATTDTDCNDAYEGTSSDATTDCNDASATVHPGASETIADGIDQNCDGTETCYNDDDNDGYLDSAADTIASTDTDCTDAYEGGTSTATTDCDDADATRSPGKSEIVADGTDQDCSGGETCYDDDDDDGYLDTTGDTRVSADNDCTDAYEGTAADLTTDCDDAVAAAHPGATELVGDGLDEDCDGAESCYDDDDGDGYLDTSGDKRASADLDCADANEGGTSTPTTDCDDAAVAVHPGATDAPADGIDNDCDGGDTCYDDDDGDGYLDPTGDTRASADLDCADANEGDGTTPTTDCDDASGAIHPGATEIAGDLIDEDCDGAELCLQDDDGDGYLDASGDSVASADGDCSDLGEGSTGTPTTDCDDADGAMSPAATEVAGDEVDQNCDGFELCWNDGDDDGQLGAAPTSRVSADTDCADANEGLTADATTDCDDARADVYLGAAEVGGDGVDQDCDGADVCFLDDDGDGFGTADVVTGATLDCSGVGESTRSDDCEPDNGNIYPGAAEYVGDGVDEDCDGTELCLVDLDGDGRGSNVRVPSTSLACDGPGLSPSESDCDDANAAVYVGAPEIPADGVDENCDLQEICYVDTDGDGFGDAGTPVSSFRLDCGEPGVADNALDCDDADPGVHPGATEGVADGVDEDCDGEELCHEDADGDGVGVAAQAPSAALDCVGAGVSARADDCDDTRADRAPTLEEVPGDGVDQDCDLGDTCYVDMDGDGYGTEALVRSSDTICAGNGEAAEGGDCADDADRVFPGAAETCNTVDDDCDGTIDDGVDDCDTARDKTFCGCGTTDGAGAAASGLLLAAALLARRRR